MPTPSLVLNSAASAYPRSALSSPPKRGNPLPAQESFAQALKADRGHLRGGPTAESQPSQPLEPPLEAADVGRQPSPDNDPSVTVASNAPGSEAGAEASTEGRSRSDQPTVARLLALASDTQPSRAVDGAAQTAAPIAQGLPNGSSAAADAAGPTRSLSTNLVAVPTIEEVGQTADTGAVVRPEVSEQSPAPGSVTIGEQRSVQSAVDPDRRQGEDAGRLLPMRGAGPSSGQASEHTHGQAKALQPSGLVADPTLGREGNRNEGEAQGRTGQGSTRWLANRDDAAPPRSAAIGRAMQVQAAVHLENATGQAPTAEVMAMTHAQFSPGSSATATTAQGLGALPADGGLASSQALVDGDRFTAGVMRGLSAMLNQRGGVMTMRLQPPQLGDLRVQMTIARGVVTAQFHVATPQAHALLEQSLAVLRSALEANGLTVERLTVHSMQTTNAQATRQEAADEQSQSSRHHSDAGEGRSRGRRDDDGEPLSHQFVSQYDHEVEAFDLPASRQPSAGVDSR